MARIELAPPTWKDGALPLCNIRMSNFTTLSCVGGVRQPLAPQPGFEPGTLELTALCSAVELSGITAIKLYQNL
jgi:hypothetical protein